MSLTREEIIFKLFLNLFGFGLATIANLQNKQMGFQKSVVWCKETPVVSTKYDIYSNNSDILNKKNSKYLSVVRKINNVDDGSYVNLTYLT